MGYERLNLVDGDVLTAEHISYIESGIKSLQNESDNMRNTLISILRDKDITVDNNITLSNLLQKFTYLQNPDNAEYTNTGNIIDVRETVGSGQIQLVVDDSTAASFTVRSTNGFSIDWGDTHSESFINGGEIAVTHSYIGNSGTYLDGVHTQFVVTIVPNTNSHLNYFEKDANSILAFVAKDVYFTYGADFAQLSKLRYIDFIGGSFVTSDESISLAGFCRGCSMLKRISGNVAWAYVTSLAEAFSGCIALETLSLGTSWNTINCASFYRTFYNCSSLISVPLFSTVSAATTKETFYGCSNLVSIGNGTNDTFDLMYCTTLEGMCENCTKLENVPNLVNTTSITTCKKTFKNCSSLVKLHSAQLNLALSSVTDFSEMFMNCSSLEETPTIAFDDAENVAKMFYNCASLYILQNTISLPNVIGDIEIEPTNYTLEYMLSGMDGMLWKCSALFSIPEISAPNVVSAKCAFAECVNATRANDLTLTNLKNAGHMFSGCVSLKNLPTNGFNFPEVIYADDLFAGCTTITACPNLLLPKCVSMKNGFKNCTSITQSRAYTFNSMTDISGLFSGCTSLESIGAIQSNANTSLNIDKFADGCNSLISIAYPVCSVSGQHIAYTNYPFNSSTNNASSLRFISNNIDVYSQGTNFNLMFASQYFEGTLTFSGLLHDLVLNNKSNLTSVRLVNVRENMANISVTNCNLNATNINALFTDLPIVSTSRTINVSGNPGATSCDTSIATGKNWQVITS